MMLTFYLLILAHVLADFPLQFEFIINEKCRGRARGYLWHIFILLSLMVFFTALHLSSLSTFLILVGIAIGHGALDGGKNWLRRWTGPMAAVEVWLFLLDQVAHIALVFFLWNLAPFHPNETLVATIRWLLPEGVFSHLEYLLAIYGSHIVVCLIIYTYVIFGGAVLVRKVLDLPSIGLEGMEGEEGSQTRTAGRYIGMVERALIVTLVWADALGSVAFVLAAKSIARYKDLEKKDFAEYYLVGTLMSSLIGVAGGLILRALGTP